MWNYVKRGAEWNIGTVENWNAGEDGARRPSSQEPRDPFVTNLDPWLDRDRERERRRGRFWKKRGEHPGNGAYKYNSTTSQCLQGDRAYFPKKVLYNGYNILKTGTIEIWKSGIGVAE